MNTNNQSFDFILTGEDWQGADFTLSFSLPLDGDHGNHFRKFLSRLMTDKIKVGSEVLARVSQQYCLALANKALPDSYAL